MISVEEATRLITENTAVLPAKKMPLTLASGLVLAEDVVALQSIPAYPQSSMDGYACAYDGSNKTFRIIGEMPAGSTENVEVEKGTAVRIFTGAAVPAGADTVVMQEKVRIENGLLMIEQDNLKTGDNVRPVGSEILQGAMALQQGDVLTPAAIGFLAGIGLGAAKVYTKPVVSIIVTGNELQHPGMPLQYGQVYESNSFTLLAALHQMYLGEVVVYQSPDSLDTLQQLLHKALQQSDVVMLTGGVSVGDYDFTLQAFEACGVKTIFHKIKQKPGKPLLFGIKEKRLVFGLPGNPASVLTCFYKYVLPALEQMMQRPSIMKGQSAKVTNDYKKASGLTHFLKAYYDGSTVQLLLGQESYKLHSFAKANCVAVVPEEATNITAGDLIDIILLPQ